MARNFRAVSEFAEVPKLLRHASNTVIVPDLGDRAASQSYPNPLVDYALAWIELEPGDWSAAVVAPGYMGQELAFRIEPGQELELEAVL